MKRQVKEAKGSILITLIVTITLLSALTAGILSFSASSSLTTVNVSNINRAHHLAESGMRYSKLVKLPENSYLTVSQNGNGLFQIFDESSSTVPTTISTSGFRIAYDDCRLQSTGIIGEGTLFEVSRTMEYSYSASLPCYWSFNLLSPNPVFPLKDEYSGNLAFLKGAIPTCEGKIGRGVFLDGSDYVETDFQPFCGIGNSNSFTVAFWAKPDPGSEGMVLGVSDGESRFSFGIKGNKWMWAYGDQEGAGASVLFDRWQFVYASFDAFTKILKISVDDCSNNDLNPSQYEYEGSETLPEGVKSLFLGAENRNGNPHRFFNGIIDEVRIYQGVVNFGKQFCPEIDTVAFYPFSDASVENKSFSTESFEHFDVIYPDSENPVFKFVTDRFDCPDYALTLEEEGDYIHIGYKPESGEVIDQYPYAVSLWFKSSPLGSSDRQIFGIAYNDEPVQHGLFLSVNEEGRAVFQAGANTMTPLEFRSESPADDDDWHFVVVIVRQNGFLFYLDGVQVDAEDQPTGFQMDPVPNINRVRIGNWDGQPDGGANPNRFIGSIDDIAVYTKKKIWDGEKNELILTEDVIRELSQQRLFE
ncbi:MAG: LamG-like jellyroll fold domain-containing protein [Thermodesulfobacteriota bacterium]